MGNRLHSDLNAVCPGISSITGSVDNLWFLNFLSSRKDIRKLSGMHQDSLLSIRGVGKKYAKAIGEWQRRARFSSEVKYVGPMIISDAKRLLELMKQIADLENRRREYLARLKSLVETHLKVLESMEKEDQSYKEEPQLAGSRVEPKSNSDEEINI